MAPSPRDRTKDPHGIDDVMIALDEIRRAMDRDRFSLETVKGGLNAIPIIEREVRDLQESSKLKLRDIGELKEQYTEILKRLEELSVWRYTINDRFAKAEGASKAIRIFWLVVTAVIGGIGWILSFAQSLKSKALP